MGLTISNGRNELDRSDVAADAVIAVTVDATLADLVGTRARRTVSRVDCRAFGQ